MARHSDRKFAIVTGASSGIGLELARQFLANQFDVMIVAQSAEIHDVARQLHSDDVRIYPQEADLATREGVDRICSVLDDLRRPIDAIALNAGVGVGGGFLETDLEAEVRMIRL